MAVFLRPKSKDKGKAMRTKLTDLQRQVADALEVPLETSRQFAERIIFDAAFRALQPANRVEAGRRDAIKLKIIDPNIHDRLKAVRAGWDAQALPRTYSEQALLSQNTWSKDEAAKPMPAGLEKDRIAYLKRELARASYGLPTARSVAEWEQLLSEAQRVPTPIPVEQTYQPSRDMISKLGLPADQRLSLDSFNSAVVALHKLDEQEKARQVSAKARQVIEAEQAQGGAE